MAAPELVYVDIYGNEVSENDPAAQAKYSPAELKALKRGGFFPKRGDDERVDAFAESVDEGSPVMHSGVGAQDADAKPRRRAAAKDEK
jgi:hypothetical protein